MSTPSPHQFSRRTFLRGVGVTMALPWLESAAVWGDEPGRASRPASEAPVRVAVVFSGNGFHSKEWWAKGEVAGMELETHRVSPARAARCPVDRPVQAPRKASA